MIWTLEVYGEIVSLNITFHFTLWLDSASVFYDVPLLSTSYHKALDTGSVVSETTLIAWLRCCLSYFLIPNKGN